MVDEKELSDAESVGSEAEEEAEEVTDLSSRYVRRKLKRQGARQRRSADYRVGKSCLRKSFTHAWIFLWLSPIANSPFTATFVPNTKKPPRLSISPYKAWSRSAFLVGPYSIFASLDKPSLPRSRLNSIPKRSTDKSWIGEWRSPFAFPSTILSAIIRPCQTKNG